MGRGWPKLVDIRAGYNQLQKFGSRKHVDWTTQVLRYMLSALQILFIYLIRLRKEGLTNIIFAAPAFQKTLLSYSSPASLWPLLV
jgi:hypothetical protein